MAKKTLADLEHLDRFGPEFERKIEGLAAGPFVAMVDKVRDAIKRGLA